MDRFNFAELAVGGATTALGAVLLFLVIPAGIDTSDVGRDGRILLRPDFWPSILALLMMAVGASVAGLQLLRRPNNRRAPAPALGKHQINPWGIVAACTIVVLLVLAERFGLLITGILIFLVAAFSIDRGHKGTKIVAAIVFPCAMIFFFEDVARVPMPMGDVITNLLGR